VSVQIFRKSNCRRRVKQGWRIADITWQREDGTTDTLRGLYVKK
jgi:hypothetical protein